MRKTKMIKIDYKFTKKIDFLYFLWLNKTRSYFLEPPLSRTDFYCILGI